MKRVLFDGSHIPAVAGCCWSRRWSCTWVRGKPCKRRRSGVDSTTALWLWRACIFRHRGQCTALALHFHFAFSLVTRLGYVHKRAQELLDCYPLRYKNENGELLNPATGWLLDILITLCNEGGCEGEAPPDALELPLNRLFERVSNETYTYADDDEEGEWMPYEEFRARLCEEEAADR